MSASSMIDRFGELAGTAEDTRELVELFLSNTSQELESLDAAMQAGERSETELIAHRCAGSSGVCGVTDLMALLQHVEQHAHSGDLITAATVLPRVSAVFDRVSGILTAHLAALDPGAGSPAI